MTSRSTICQSDSSSCTGQDPSAFQNVARARKNKLVVGASSVNKRTLKAVMTKRDVDVFISRLHPETSSHELLDCVRSVGDGVKICDVTCTKLQSKYEHLYSSYHVAIYQCRHCRYEACSGFVHVG